MLLGCAFVFSDLSVGRRLACLLPDGLIFCGTWRIICCQAAARDTAVGRPDTLHADRLPVKIAFRSRPFACLGTAEQEVAADASARSATREQYEKDRRSRKRRRGLLALLGLTVALGTAGALILPAITMERTCPIPAHTHTDACYAAMRGETICGYEESDGHTHSAGCYGEDGDLLCPLPELQAHHHTDSCYAEVRGEAVCGSAEIVLHQHTDACYDETGSLCCGRLQVLEPRHTDACFTETDVPADTQTLTCTSTDAEHIHTARCYGTWVLTCGMEEHVHTDECYASAAEPDDPGADPDDVFYYTTVTMSGYIRLEPQGLAADPSDVTVTLSLPKQYVEKDTFQIPKFATNSEVTSYEILPLEEDAENYSISIQFFVYDKTQTMVLPFTLSFLDNVVPDNYALPVTASVSYSGSETRTDPNVYRPLYDPWQIVKFVNSNRLDAFGQDGAEVVVTPEEEGGNPYLSETAYVDFAFIVNDCTYANANLQDRRDACEVTLTDTLPQYTDRDGNSCIAVFDAEQNPGWTLGSDGTTVSKTYTGSHSGDVLTQIYNDKLRLRFPGLRFDTTQDGSLIADLENNVHLTAVPSGADADETRPEADDSLLFRLTTDPGTGGIFTKGAVKGDIYDVDIYKTNPYPWELALSNNKAQPLRHIVIQDRRITEDGAVVLAGLDESLKFVRLESRTAGSVLPEGKTFADITEKVTAYYTDGTTEDLPITETDASGNFTVTFDETRVCDGYDIVFRDDYAMQAREKVVFRAYTVYRDPAHTHVPDGAEKVTYTNAARSVNSYQNGAETVYVYLPAAHSYDMLPSTETLSVKKGTLVNNGSIEWDGIGGNTVGSTYAYELRLTGSLLEPEVKVYQDLRIVDLLPDGVRYERIHLIQQDTNAGPILDGGRDYQPQIVENYHNSGRTAVIFHLNAENLKTSLAETIGGVAIYFGVTIQEDARPGTVRNYVYIVGDNLDEYSGKEGKAADIYDLNNNGRTDDQLAYSCSDATIIAVQSIYAEKFIAPAGSDNWSKQGLLVKAGGDFDYLLRITNETSDDYHDLTIYDTLPRIHDRNIFAQASRGSEFSVRLRGPITPPEGYTVRYTTSEDVYQTSMHDMLDRDVWTDSVSDYAAVTAFRIDAGETAVLAKNSVFEVRIPAGAPAQFDDASMALLHGKQEQDQPCGTASWLEAVNAFGFRTRESSAEKESNSVWARVPFAGFCVKKVDGASGNALAGAEFTLRDAAGTVIAAETSGEDGRIQFRELTEGVYTLTETVVPDGYMDKNLSMTVTISQNSVTMEYTIDFDGADSGAGSAADPLRIENYGSPMLPETGGRGLSVFYAAGGLPLASAALVWILRKRSGANR